MEIGVAAKEYLIEIEVRKFTPKTIRSYRNNLNLFLRFCEEEAGIAEIENVSLAVVRQFSRFMSERGRKGRYINGLLKVAKAFIQYCYEEGYGGFNTKKNFKWCKQAIYTPLHERSIQRTSEGLNVIMTAFHFTTNKKPRRLFSAASVSYFIWIFCYRAFVLSYGVSVK